MIHIGILKSDFHIIVSNVTIVSVKEVLVRQSGRKNRIRFYRDDRFVFDEGSFDTIAKSVYIKSSRSFRTKHSTTETIFASETSA